ncbi:hypothetical protein ETAA8_07110 [Anatilimnocola aggregata]|uniref:Uncharacterized protein n=1 Tax=Anatilimnocola aggregata TaxID=2528021 RepID=A0A517Y5X9_9BACT|nr:hypothetical protein [Anatilimnocola aggregata]QDU25641.1 hypothetical protein ETAA8_07110 [Anatilimnocola aggregata]
MDRRTKKVGVVLALVAMVVFILPMCGWLWYLRVANANLVTRTRAVVEKNPQLQAAWEQAMQDKMLTAAEAKAIEDAAGQPAPAN